MDSSVAKILYQKSIKIKIDLNLYAYRPEKLKAFILSFILSFQRPFWEKLISGVSLKD